VLLRAASAENKRRFLGVGVRVEKELGQGLLEFISVEASRARYPELLWGHEHLRFFLLYLIVFEKPQGSGGAGWVSVVLFLSLQESARYNKIFETWEHHGADSAPRPAPSPSTTPLGLVSGWVPQVKRRKKRLLRGVTLNY